MTRKLAKIVVVDDIRPHDNADALEIAVVGGWCCCVKKGEFHKGSMGVYFEVDSMLPLSDERFAFLKGRNERVVDGKAYSRIKTMKLRGQLSQGLLLPIHHFLDTDIASNLSVIKYEVEADGTLRGKAAGTFPWFIRKTDQERVQNLKTQVETSRTQGETFEVTYKLDGSSFTAYVLDGETGLCSRNQELKKDDDDSLFVKTFNKYSLDEKLKTYFTSTGRNIAIQGEMVGPKIQSNFEGVSETRLYVYSVFDIESQEYLLPEEARDVVDVLGLDYVPIYSEKSFLPETLDELIAGADGESGLFGKYREGLVWKSNSRDFSFKVISNSYLLKEK